MVLHQEGWHNHPSFTIVIWFTTYFGFVDGAFQMLEEDQIDSSIQTIGKRQSGTLFRRDLAIGKYNCCICYGSAARKHCW